MRSEAAFEELAWAIRGTHSGEPGFVGDLPVHETSEGQTVCDGVVHVSNLSGNPTVSRTYAWSHKVEGTARKGSWSCCTSRRLVRQWRP